MIEAIAKHIRVAVVRKLSLLLLVALFLLGTSRFVLAQTSATYTINANGNWSTNSNWTPAAYPDNGGTATFGLISASRTITLDVPVNVSVMDFGPENLAGNAYVISGPNTLTLSGAGTVTTASGALQTINAPINITSTLVHGGGGSLILGGAVTGNIANNGAILFINSTLNGALTLNGGTVQLNGASGQLTGTSGLTLNGGTFQILTSTVNADRINNSTPISLAGGSFAFLGSVAAGGYNESMGPMTLDAGHSSYTMVTTTSTTNTGRASVTNFTRNNRATAAIGGTNLGQSGSFASPTSSAYLKISNSTNETNFIATMVGAGTAFSTTSKNNSIVPYLIGATSSGGEGSTFITYNTTAGFIALNVGNNYDATIPAGAATDNVRLSTAFTLTPAASTMNSLMIAQLGTISGGKLTITSGALAMGTFTTGGTDTISNDLQFGASDTAEAVITVTSLNTLSLNGVISTSGGLTKGGLGTLILNNTSNSYTGPTTINGAPAVSGNNTSGGLRLGASNVIPDPSAVVLSGGVLDLNGNTDTVGSIAGAGTIALGAGALTAGGDNTNTSYAGAITGTGGFTKVGSGTLTLSASNSFSGGIFINGGALSIDAFNRLGALPGSAADVVTINGGTLQITAAAQSSAAARGFLIGPSSGSGTGTIEVLGTTNAQISGTLKNNGGGVGSLVKRGPGTLTLGGQASYSGGTTIADGTVSIGADNILPTGTSLSLGDSLASTNGVFNLNGHQQTVAQLSNVTAGAVVTNLGTADGMITVTGSSTYSGVISDGPTNKTGLLKSVGGTFTLTGANTYTGNTTISAGTLALGASATLASPRIIVGTAPGSGAVFDVSAMSGGFTLANNQVLSGHGTVLGSMTVSGAISPGSSPGNLTTGDQAWDADNVGGAGMYAVEVTNPAGTAGSGWDHIQLTSLSLVATGSGSFTIAVSGTVPGFQQDTPFAVRIVNGTIQQSVLNNLNRLNVDASAFLASNGANHGGYFGLDVGSDFVDLTYTPEPGGLGAILGLTMLVRRRQRQSHQR